jgi:hypothetical protein
MPNYKKKLTPADFASIGELALRDRWQLSIAEGMGVDPATVQDWVKNGPPEDVTETLRTFLGARRNNISAALDQFLAEPLKPWDRGVALLAYYEMLTDDPTMIYSQFENNRDMVVRVMADLLQYCMDRITVLRTFIDLDAVVKDAISVYTHDPEHSATPVVKSAQQSEWMSKDFIPFVLTNDPAKIAAFEKKFSMTQDQAVDDLIETTDWGGQDLPHLVGNKGTPKERLSALRIALRAGGITDNEE